MIIAGRADLNTWLLIWINCLLNISQLHRRFKSISNAVKRRDPLRDDFVGRVKFTPAFAPQTPCNSERRQALGESSPGLSMRTIQDALSLALDNRLQFVGGGCLAKMGLEHKVRPSMLCFIHRGPVSYESAPTTPLFIPPTILIYEKILHIRKNRLACVCHADFRLLGRPWQ